MAESTTELAVRDKVVVITGAARGIGQEFARSLAAAGALVVAADINDCSATLELANGENGKAIGVALDVRSAESASDMIDATTRAFGRVDALINNAALYGALRGSRFDAIAEADWDAAMAVNVTGVWNCCKAVVPAMRQAGGGRHHQSRLARRDLRHAICAALYDVESGGDRIDSWARP